MKGIHRKGLKMINTEVKAVNLVIDVKQLFALEEILNTIRHDYPTEWASRSYYEELRQYLKVKVLEVL
jgi:uncharacterized LabA/DUF88 family protein